MRAWPAGIFSRAPVLAKRPFCAWLELATLPRHRQLPYYFHHAGLLPVASYVAAFVPQRVKRRVQWWNSESPVELFGCGTVGSYQRSTWRQEKVLRAASRVKSLKPHCVSLIPLTQKNHTRKWKPYIRNVRNTDRCGNGYHRLQTVSPARVPQRHSFKADQYLSYGGFLQVSSGTTGNGHVALNIHRHFWSDTTYYVLNMYEKKNTNTKQHLFSTGFGLRSQRAASTFSMSENLVAPSASAIRMSFPLQIIVPFKSGAKRGKTRRREKLASVYARLNAGCKCNSSGTCLVSPSARHLLCPGSSPVSWPAPCLGRALSCTATPPDGTPKQDKSFARKKVSKKVSLIKQMHLRGLVFASVVDYNDLIGKGGVLFLWKRPSGIYKVDFFNRRMLPSAGPWGVMAGRHNF